MGRGQSDQIGQDLIERSIACDHLDDARLFDEEEFGLLLDRDIPTDPDEADDLAGPVLIANRDLGGGVPPPADPFAMVDDRNAGADEILLADEELFGPFREWMS